MGPLCYRRHRFPPEIIQHAIWLYLRFTLSYRYVEELLNALLAMSVTCGNSENICSLSVLPPLLTRNSSGTKREASNATPDRRRPSRG